MNKQIMIKHYEATPKETLIDILVASREEVEKLQNKNKECKREIERLNNIVNELEHDFESYELDYLQDTYQGSLADFIETELERIQELKGVDKE